MSLIKKRTQPPIFKKGIRRCCCNRLTLGIETLSKFATSAIVSNSTVELLGIFIKERHRIGKADWECQINFFLAS